MIYRNREWLYEQYVTKQRTLSDIANESGVKTTTIHSWRNKLGIEKVIRPSDNNTIVKVQCRQCKEDFETTLRYVWRRVRDENRTYFYCNNRCQTASLRGKKFPGKGLKRDKNPAWKGGVSPINENLRDAVKLWKREVMIRDNYTCFISGNRVRNFHIHHITPFHKIRDMAIKELGIILLPTLAENDSDEFERLKRKIYDLHREEVGYVIDADIHKQFHKIYGFNANKEDLLEFKSRYGRGEFHEETNAS